MTDNLFSKLDGSTQLLQVTQIKASQRGEGVEEEQNKIKNYKDRKKEEKRTPFPPPPKKKGKKKKGGWRKKEKERKKSAREKKACHRRVWAITRITVYTARAGHPLHYVSVQISLKLP